MDLSSPVELAEIAAAPHRLLGVTIAVEGEGPEPAPKCARNPGVLYGLGNLIENAVSFAKNAVVKIVQTAAHFKSDAEMRVVVKIRACRNNPIDESGTH